MSSRQHITLTRLQGLIKEVLWSTLERSYWVSAELSEVKVNSSGHCYLELLEKGERGHLAKAKVKAVIWRNSYAVISDYFYRETGSPLSSGMQVLVNISVSYHELYGMSLVVNDIDPTYTLGDIERTRRETIERLRREGIFEMNKEIEASTVLQRLAVISSKNAAGFQDFIKELGKYRGRYGFDITLFGAVMQGADTEPTVTSALERIFESGVEYDAVVIIRGGGSQSDLSAFDSYMICSYVAQSPLPVITGIGHDKDITAVDLVAHTSLKTPTAVARHIIDSFEMVDTMLESAMQRLKEQTRERVDSEQRYLEQAKMSLERITRSELHSKELYLRGATERLRSTTGAFIKAKSSRIDECQVRLPRLSSLFLDGKRQRLVALEQLAEAFSPKRIFALGYSVARSRAGVVRRAADLSLGETIKIELVDATVEAKVESIS